MSIGQKDIDDSRAGVMGRIWNWCHTNRSATLLIALLIFLAVAGPFVAIQFATLERENEELRRHIESRRSTADPVERG